MFNLKDLKKFAVRRKAVTPVTQIDWQPPIPEAKVPEPVVPEAPAKPKRVRKAKAKAKPLAMAKPVLAVPTKKPKPKKR